MEQIFVVTCYYAPNLEQLKQGNFSPNNFTRSREWGFYFNFSSAFNCVKYNFTDIYEHGYYNLVCIEEKSEGILSGCESSYWFEVNYPEENTPEVKFLPECFFSKCYSYGYQPELPDSVVNYLTKYEIAQKIIEGQEIEIEIRNLNTQLKANLVSIVLINNETKIDLSNLDISYEQMNQDGVARLEDHTEVRFLRR